MILRTLRLTPVVKPTTRCSFRVAPAAAALRIPNPRTPQRLPWTQPYRTFVSTRTADEIIEEITEQYSTAKDEFEIAAEETEKKTVYAADDRAAAQEEVQKLKELFESSVESSSEEVAKEIKRRVGSRIRELDGAMQGLEEFSRQE